MFQVSSRSLYDPSERTQTAFVKKRRNRKREEEEEFGIILRSFSASGCQMGQIRLFRQSGSKNMCFISQSGRDLLFRCTVANLTCKKPYKTLILCDCCSTSCIFSENPCARMHMLKKCQKTHVFPHKNMFFSFLKITFKKNCSENASRTLSGTGRGPGQLPDLNHLSKNRISYA